MTLSTIYVDGVAYTLNDMGDYPIYSTVWWRTWREEVWQAVQDSAPWRVRAWEAALCWVNDKTWLYLPRGVTWDRLRNALDDAYRAAHERLLDRADPVVVAFCETGSDLEYGLTTELEAALYDQRMQEEENADNERRRARWRSSTTSDTPTSSRG